jgi:predicted DNA-binding transcriptional regulator AlpA
MTYLKMREVMKFTGMTRAEIWEKIEAGKFPKPVHLPPTGHPNDAHNYWVQEQLTPSPETQRKLERPLKIVAAP